MEDYNWDTLIAMGCNNYRWSFNLLKLALWRHRISLRKLSFSEIGPLRGELRLFDICAFEQIESFQVDCSARSLPPPAKVCEQWVTPKLRRLTLKFERFDSQLGPSYFFHQEELEWINDFTHLVELKKMSTDCALHEIEIISVNRYLSKHYEESRGLLEQALNCIKRHGLVAICPQRSPHESPDSGEELDIDSNLSYSEIASEPESEGSITEGSNSEEEVFQ